MGKATFHKAELGHYIIVFHFLLLTQRHQISVSKPLTKVTRLLEDDIKDEALIPLVTAPLLQQDPSSKGRLLSPQSLHSVKFCEITVGSYSQMRSCGIYYLCPTFFTC